MCEYCFFLDLQEDGEKKIRLLFSKLHEKEHKPSLVVIAFRKETRRKMQQVLAQVREFQTKVNVKINKAGLSFNAVEMELSLSEMKDSLPLRCRSTALSENAYIDVPTIEDSPLEPSQPMKSGKIWRRAIRGMVKLCTCCCVRQQGAKRK